MVKLLDRKLITSNSRFRIFFDHVRDEKGHEVKDFLMVEPIVTKSDLVTGILVLPINTKGELGLINIYRHVLGMNSWEVVKGFVEPTENVTEAAIRELREETCCEADEDRLASLQGIAAESGVIKGKNQAFIARDCRVIETASSDEMGLNDFKFFSEENVKTMISNGEIFDAGTLGCLCHYFIGR